MKVERWKQETIRIVVAEVLPPAGFASIGVRQALVMKIAIARIYDAAAATRHVRFAVHRRKRGDVSECADGTAINFGAMRLAAILDDANPASVRLPDDVADVHRLANRMHHHDGPDLWSDTS